MGLVPIEEKILDLSDPDNPALLGCRCKACGEVYFPIRHRCAKGECLSFCEEVTLSRTGTLYTWTYVHHPKYGKQQMEDAPYMVGQVDLPEGTRIQGIISGIDPKDVQIGMKMKVALDYLIKNENGDDVVSYCFVPAGGDGE